MNPLTFFPPPSRSLSRVDSRPGSDKSDKSGNGASSRNKRNGLQPLSTGSNNASRTRMQSNGPSSSSSSRNASGTTTPEGHEHDAGHASSNAGAHHKSLRPMTSPGLTSPTSGLRSPLLASSDSFQGYSSDHDARQHSGTNSPRRPSGLDSPRLRDRSSSYTGSGAGSISSSSATSMAPSSSSPAKRGTNATTQSSGGRLGHRLPQGMYIDLVRAGEVGQVHKLERESYHVDDTATLDTLRNRQRDAPHLFLGAFLPLPPPKVSGPLSMSGPPPRKLIAYACGTAASAYTARAIKMHSDDEHAWLVCMHSVCVAQEYRHKGVALRMIEEYVRRLRRAESSPATKKNYECVAVLSHEEMVPLYEKAGFKKLGYSHVNIGSGGWLEMRRWIVPKDDEAGEQPESGSGSPNEKSSLSGSVVVTSATTAEAKSEDGHEAATTPTQELERRLHAHVATLSGDATASDTGDTCKEKSRPAPTLTTANLGVGGNVTTATGGGAKLSSSPTPMSPTLSDEATTAAKAATKSPNASISSEGSAPITTAKIVDALRKQAATGGSHPGSGAQSPRNPGMAYSTIMGQTLAAKTSVEDAFYALEARLVNREDQSTLADLYCPREECACLLVKAGNADWEFAEMGPLSQAGLSLPNSPAPPSTPLPPPPTSLDRVRSALGAQRAPAAASSVHAFWIVHSPMLFENVGFSRDADWRLPPLPSMSASSGGGSEGGNGSETGNGSDASGGGERKKPTKRGSLLRNASGWLANRGEARKRSNTLHMIDSQGNTAAAATQRNVRSPTMSLSPPLFDSIGSGSSATSSSNDSASASVSNAAAPATSAGSLVKVKYLLCADCDCGPLGYTVLPRSLEGGNFAKEVGKQVNGGEADEEATPAAAPETPLYFVAADRVRYRLPK